MAVVRAEPTVDDYRALGLGTEATPLDVQLAYINQSKAYNPMNSTGSDARKAFVRAHQAFMAFSNDEMRDESLALVNYWEHVLHIEDEEGLKLFSEFQPGGSAHLRVLFVMDNPGMKSWQIYATAAALHGKAHVAQLHASGALRESSFFQSFKVGIIPSAVIVDPISRAVKVSDGLEGVQEGVQLTMGGHLSHTDKMARIQEWDAETDKLRCGGDNGAERCKWKLLIATDAAFEKRDDMMQTMKSYVEACRTLGFVREDTPRTSACFWLRLKRAPDWWQMLVDHGAGATDEFIVAALGNKPPHLLVAPPEKVNMKADQFHTWLQDELYLGTLPAHALGPLPPLPDPLESDEEPPEDTKRIMWRMLLWGLAVLRQRLDLKAFDVQGHWNKMETEEKTMAVGAVLLVVWVLFTLCKYCCCKKRSKWPTEDEALTKLMPIVAVDLPRKGLKKLGIHITAAEQDTFNISGVDGDGLLGQWNTTEPVSQRRIYEGDRLVCVTTYENGKEERATSQSSMSKALHACKDVTLGIAVPRGPAFFQRLHGTVVLSGLTLEDAVELVHPQYSFGGSFDAAAGEIAKISPKLVQWNAARRQDTSCCLQRLQVGDRIISVNSITNVRANLKLLSPHLVVVRWRPHGVFRADNFDVTIEHTTPEGRLGMQIAPRACEKDTEVLEVVPGGAIKDYNDKGPVKPVLKGDRIVAVNGVKERKSFGPEMGKRKVVLSLQRWIDDSPDSESVDFASGPPAGAGSAPAAAVPKAAVPPGPSKASSSGPCCCVLVVVSILVAGTAVGMALNQPGGIRAQKAGWMEPILESAMSISAAVAAAIMETSDTAAGSQRPNFEPAAVTLEGGAVQMPDSTRKFMEQIHPELYFDIAMLFFAVGSIPALRFLRYEVSMLWKPAERRLLPQMVVAMSASVFLGFGYFFLLVWAGVYT